MRRNVYFTPVVTGLFNKRVTEEVKDRRGKKRTIKFSTGVNKGKVYPYASKRQLARKYGASRKPQDV